MNNYKCYIAALTLVLVAGCNSESGGNSGSVEGDDSNISTSGALDWESAIQFCESLNYAEYDDWRLPNIKELHSIVDYSLSPNSSGTAAIDSTFISSQIINEGGEVDYPYYWSSTTHISGSGKTNSAAYIAFGLALGYMSEEWKDVHGAGSQRSDPKSGDASDYPEGHGPQGDAIRIDNYVRCVRDDNTIVSPSYTIVDTNQNNNTTTTFGEDSDYMGNQPSYAVIGNGEVIEDKNTGLMWQQSVADKVSYSDAINNASTINIGGYDDWRLPTIKELYSLIIFSGEDATSCTGTTDECTTKKFIDTDFFEQPYGNTDDGYRAIDAQTWSATEYVSTTMNGDETVFGLNFVDGRIKGYPKYKKSTGTDNLLHVRYVRGNSNYQSSNFIDNSDNTITDNATGLMWMKNDSGTLE
ncbi:hypothetical protein A9264_12870 [Vibrio sp. UCD-FRSSP16_10]|uniref:Lcl C-terminal domain-containing protein n=1 Tax=unclassified Vibrio TaxID=2614977 RepID=UPI0007FF4FF8|nr:MULTISPECIES: DUF1566 domain-containing protein [unclassified Vibrio]OBT15553.1 hypothetical protein A9260_13085 [Vibrio sp. UCD-FRSSP16_30]OBT20626.1 hypothetical protein A9264_12870 [Vibrio sp. UCD-FRSSP16_10]